MRTPAWILIAAAVAMGVMLPASLFLFAGKSGAISIEPSPADSAWWKDAAKPAPEKPVGTMPADVAEVTVRDLFAAANKDMAAADSRFVRQWIVINGRIKSIEESELKPGVLPGTMSVTLDAGDDNLSCCVLCIFDPPAAKQLAKLKPGSTVRIAGVGGALMAIVAVVEHARILP
jgi:hypothetical protein